MPSRSEPPTAIVEDFETGDLSQFLWVTGGDRPWSVTDVQTHSGQYAVQSGPIGHNEVSWLEINLATEAGTLSFWYRVSSEHFDPLRFFIDGREKGKWSGETGWRQIHYEIDAGNHKFRWEYSKDRSESLGDDAAWVDDIAFPMDPREAPCAETVFAERSIQAAIDRAHPHEVVCLAGGVWEEELVIEKSLTLRGVDAERSIIQGIQGGRPAIWVRPRQTASQELSVRIERLAVIGAGRSCTRWFEGICDDGVLIIAPSQVRLTDVRITSNGFYGIVVGGGARLALAHALVVGNRADGVRLMGSAQAEIIRSTISGNGEDGIALTDSSSIELSEVTITGNGDAGVQLLRSGRGKVLGSTIAENGGHGVDLGPWATLELERNRVVQNGGYGVAIDLWRCFGAPAAREFRGRVSGQVNVIPSSQEPQGNVEGAVCPPALEFLTTERGGTYP